MSTDQKKKRGRPVKAPYERIFQLWCEYVDTCKHSGFRPTRSHFCQTRADQNIRIRTLRRALASQSDGSKIEIAHAVTIKGDPLDSSATTLPEHEVATIVEPWVMNLEVPRAPLTPGQLLQEIVISSISGKGPFENPTLALRALVAEHWRVLASELNACDVGLIILRQATIMLQAKRIEEMRVFDFAHNLALNGQGVFERSIKKRELGSNFR